MKWLADDVVVSEFLEARSLERGYIHLQGTIESYDVECLHQALMWLSRNGSVDAIHLILNSPGGTIFAAMGIYDLLREAAKFKPVHVHGVGLVASAAVAVLQAGDYRSASPNTRFLMHEPSVTKLFDEETTASAEEQARDLQAVTGRLARIIGERSGIEIEKLREMWYKKDYWFWADEALELGLIDRVGVSS